MNDRGQCEFICPLLTVSGSEPFSWVVLLLRWLFLVCCFLELPSLPRVCNWCTLFCLHRSSEMWSVLFLLELWIAFRGRIPLCRKSELLMLERRVFECLMEVMWADGSIGGHIRRQVARQASIEEKKLVFSQISSLAAVKQTNCLESFFCDKFLKQNIGFFVLGGTGQCDGGQRI